MSNEVCDHDWEYEGDDYGPLASDMYEVYQCKRCANRSYAPLAD